MMNKKNEKTRLQTGKIKSEREKKRIKTSSMLFFLLLKYPISIRLDCEKKLYIFYIGVFIKIV